MRRYIVESWLFLALALVLTPPAQVQAQFTFVANGGGLTITAYTGPGGDVIIPSFTNGFPVTSIADGAFDGFIHPSPTTVTIPDSITYIGNGAFNECTLLKSVMIGSGVTRIGGGAFYWCTSLTSITVNPLNSFYTSVAGVLFDRGTNTLLKYPGFTSAQSYTIPNTVTNIVGYAFEHCILSNVTIPYGVTTIGAGTFFYSGLRNITLPGTLTSIDESVFNGCMGLTNIIIPNGVMSIGDNAFASCFGLTSIEIPSSVNSIGSDAFWNSALSAAYFRGMPPSLGSGALYGHNTISYYLPGMPGWGSTFGDRPTALWSLPYPVILNTIPSFGIQSNQFSFMISWATNISVVVEASTNLATGSWLPLTTNSLIAGTNYFSDPQWTNYPARFYRVRSP